jgi:CheY-like chemotaxis protein
MVSFKVLIVDDDFVNRKLLMEILRKNIYRVEIIESVDGKDALEIVKSHSDIDLILLDIEMPKVNGIEFLDIYNSLDIKRVPIIAFSSNDLRKRSSKEKGASVFIVKPITKDKLLNAISKLYFNV